MEKKCYLRFREPRTLDLNGTKVSFTEWHWLEITLLPNDHESHTRVRARDCRGHVIEALHRDLCAWSRRFILTEDFGALGIHETVDLLDPSTCDGETVIVLAGKTNVRVPVKCLAPWSGRHAHEGAMAV